MTTRAFTALGTAALLLLATPAARSDDTTPKPQRAHSVAEMLQLRQENQLRDQLLKEGRIDEVRKLDEANAQRAQERQGKAVAQLNEDLARGSNSASQPHSALVEMCDRETLRMRLNSGDGATASAAPSAY